MKLDVGLRHASSPRPFGDRRAALRGELEVGEGARTVEVEGEPDYLAVAYAEHARTLRSHQSELNAARLAAPSLLKEHKDALAVDLAVLVCLGVPILPRDQICTAALRHPG